MVHAGQRATAESCAHCRCNAADIPGFVPNFARKPLKFISVVKSQSFSSCRDQVQRLACALALDINFAGSDMRANRHARTFLGSLWCPDFPPAPQVGFHTYSRLTCRELVQARQRCMLKDEPLTRSRSFWEKESDQLAPLQSMGSAHQHRQKPWHRSGWNAVDRRLCSALDEQDDPSYQRSWIFAENQHLNSIVEEQHWDYDQIKCHRRKAAKFLTCQQYKHSCTILPHPRKDSKQPVSSRSIGNDRNFLLGIAGVFLSSYLQSVVENCRQIIVSHAPIIDWTKIV